MNQLHHSLLIIILFFKIACFGQSFTGTVLDKDTKQPIAFAQVYLVDLKTGTTSNTNGVFKLEKIYQNKVHIQITFVGYNLLDEILDIEHLKSKIFYLEEGHFELEEIVVSTPSGRLQGENIVSIQHKKLKTLQQNSPLTLAEAISTIPGVNQTTTGAGIGKPVIRGLSGNRIVTYAQGIRIENQQWGDEHGLGVGSVGIESVEVIKGPASLLYGSDALGGVLYFIDERYASQNSIETFIESKFMSNTIGTINNLGFKINKGKLKFNLFGSYSSQADYQTSDFVRVFNSRFNQKNIKTSVGYNVKNWILNLRYSYLNNNFGIVEDSVYTKLADRKFLLPFQTIDNHNVSFENIFFVGKSKLNITLGYTNNYRKEFEDNINAQALGLKLNTFTYNIKWHSPIYKKRFDYIIGSQAMVQNNLNNGEEILVPNAKKEDVGLFWVGNLKFDKIQFQGGLRIDYRKINSKKMISNDVNFAEFDSFYNGFTFSGGTVYRFKKTKIRANISNGFRPPNTAELLSNGVQPGTNRFVIGNTYFKSENATQIDVSFNYQYKHFSFVINPFFNTIKNYIFLSPTAQFINSIQVFKYSQTNAILYGGESGFHYHPHKVHWLHIESNLSTVFADNTFGSLPLIPQTKINSTISVEIKNEGKVKLKRVFVQHIYKFKQNKIGLFETITNDYHLINLGLSVNGVTLKIMGS